MHFPAPPLFAEDFVYSHVQIDPTSVWTPVGGMSTLEQNILHKYSMNLDEAHKSFFDAYL